MLVLASSPACYFYWWLLPLTDNKASIQLTGILKSLRISIMEKLSERFRRILKVTEQIHEY